MVFIDERVYSIVHVGLERELFQRCPVAEEQHTVGKPIELGRASPALVLGEAQDAQGLPDRAPAAGEHARAHGIMRRQEGQHVEEEIVWEGADVVLAPRCSSSHAPRRHCVEQVPGAGAATGQGVQTPEDNHGNGGDAKSSPQFARWKARSAAGRGSGRRRRGRDMTYERIRKGDGVSSANERCAGQGGRGSGAVELAVEGAAVGFDGRNGTAASSRSTGAARMGRQGRRPIGNLGNGISFFFFGCVRVTTGSEKCWLVETFGCLRPPKDYFILYLNTKKTVV